MTSGGSKTHGRPPKSRSMFAQRSVTSELNISGSQILVLVIGACLAGPLVWGFVKYWLFSP